MTLGQKTQSLKEQCFCLLFPQTNKKENSLRTLRLCGEISEFLSALICENLRLNFS